MEYSDEELAEEVRNVADLTDADGAPSFRTFKEHGEIEASTVVNRFGSWNAAVEQAGFEPNTATDKTPRADLIDELRRLRDAIGEIPTADQMDEHGAYAYRGLMLLRRCLVRYPVGRGSMSQMLNSSPTFTVWPAMTITPRRRQTSENVGLTQFRPMCLVSAHGETHSARLASNRRRPKA